jgi:hypothetical protein
MAIPRCHFWDSHPNPDFPDPDVLSCIFFHAQWPIPAPWPALRPCLSAPWNRSLGKADADGEPRDSCLRDRELSPKYPTVVGSHSIMRHQIRRYLLPSLLFITLSLALPGRGLSQAAFDAVSTKRSLMTNLRLGRSFLFARTIGLLPTRKTDSSCTTFIYNLKISAKPSAMIIWRVVLEAFATRRFGAGIKH